MNKQEYLDTLRKALAGLPPETVARTLADYEQRFVDGMAAGRSETDIAAGLDEPRKIAVTLRANVHMSAFEQKKTPVNLMRMVISFIGLAIFNLFMVVPALVFTALLVTVYACALSFYVSGIAITASGLSGTNELELDGPFREFIHLDRDGERPTRTRISISQDGLQMYQQPADGKQADPADDDDDDDKQSGKLIERAEAVASSGVHISSDLDTESRTTQTLLGLGFVIIGILLCLLSLVATRYTVLGIKRYIQMNFSMLRGR
ncbi:MAG: DUF1700 domain-containing protein [Pseudomonadota bacterium]